MYRRREELGFGTPWSVIRMYCVKKISFSIRKKKTNNMFYEAWCGVARALRCTRSGVMVLWPPNGIDPTNQIFSCRDFWAWHLVLQLKLWKQAFLVVVLLKRGLPTCLWESLKLYQLSHLEFSRDCVNHPLSSFCVHSFLKMMLASVSLRQMDFH